MKYIIACKRHNTQQKILVGEELSLFCNKQREKKRKDEKHSFF